MADRIMAMAEKQSAHRHNLEATVVRGNVRSQTLGQFFGFFVALVGLGGSIWLIHEGRSIEGFSTLVISLGGLAGLFVWGRNKQERERAEKLAALPGPRTPRP